MELFKLTKNKVLPQASALLIKEFKLIWERDNSKEKELAIKELGYVYFKADYKSIYLSTPPEDREQVIIEDVFGEKSKWKPDKAIQEAVNKYTELQRTPTMRFLDAQQTALEELITYLKNLDMKVKDKSGKPIYKYSDITRGMSDSAKVAESLEKLQERVKKELSVQGKIRGQGELGSYEDIEE